jgi:superfamily I DNA/RNA helicase
MRLSSRAEAVADLCARLIGNATVRDEEGALAPLSPGGIALLAPTGSELWRYERAFEARGLPIASQAGKGLFRRQEVQDLVALVRVLADSGTARITGGAVGRSAGTSALPVRRGKAALFQRVQVPPGNRSSRKQPEQLWRQRNS